MKDFRQIRLIFSAISLLIIHTVFLPYISIEGYIPDLFVLLLVYIIVTKGQIEATIYGFGIGLLQDVVSTKFLGLTALSKTLASFVIGYFHNENTIQQTLSTYRYVLLVVLFSIIQNLVYFIIFFQGQDSVILRTLESTTFITIYTALLGVLPVFYFAKRYSTDLI